MKLQMNEGETPWGYFCRYAHSQDVIGLHVLLRSLKASDPKYVSDLHAKIAMVRTEIKMRKEKGLCRVTK